MTPTEYQAILDAAWQDHLAPRADDALTVVSTFAGCGGSSLGYSMAGYRELAAVEWDQHAADTFRANFPDVPMWQGDIAQFTIETLREIIGDVEVDVFDGSPPCQGFSMTGHRQLDDPRNQLFREFVRLLRGLNPRAFIMENVRGLTIGRMRRVFAEIVDELTASGYVVRAALLNAESFGVPQARTRTIIIGVRNDLAIEPTFPPSTVSAVVTLDDVLDLDALDPETFDPPIPTLRGTWGRLVPIVEQGKGSSTVVGTGYSMQRNRVDRPSFTVIKTNPGTGFGTLLHPTKNRSHSIEEARLIHSIPTQFRLSGKFVDQWSRIGNSVPPLMMRAIAGHLTGLIGAGSLPDRNAPEVTAVTVP